jgi:hypothetical protein
VVSVAEHLVIDRMESLLGEAGTAMFSPCRTYRYALTRRWDSDRPAAVFVMLNPSTADAFTVDSTVRRCIGFAQRWGMGGLVVLNAFALRSTDPHTLYAHPDPVGPANDAVIAEYASRHGDGWAIVAWGQHGTYRGRDKQVTGILSDADAQTVCLGVTKDGHPRHPLYVRGDTEPVRWRP